MESDKQKSDEERRPLTEQAVDRIVKAVGDSFVPATLDRDELKKDLDYCIEGYDFYRAQSSKGDRTARCNAASTRNHKSLRRRPLTRRWWTFDLVHTNGSASSL